MNRVKIKSVICALFNLDFGRKPLGPGFDLGDKIKMHVQRWAQFADIYKDCMEIKFRDT